MAERAVMSLLACLPHHVDFQLAFAGEVLVAVGALQAGIREVQVEVLNQVGPLFETPLAFGAHVGFVQILRAFYNIPWGNKGGGAVNREKMEGTAKCSVPDPVVPGEGLYTCAVTQLPSTQRDCPHPKSPAHFR